VRNYKIILGLLAALLFPIVASANSSARGWCEIGAQTVTTSGLTSTTQVQASYPGCSITVIIHGGGTATIYSDNANTPLANPFTSTLSGQWTFFAVNGRYDITLSGGGLPSSVTYSDVVLFDAASVGGVLTSTGSPAANQVTYFTSPSQVTGTPTDTTPTHALFTTAGAPAFRQPTLADVAGGTAPAGTYNFSGVTLIQLRVGATLTTSTNGDIGYDTTNKNWHGFANGADSLFATIPTAAGVANEDCADWDNVTGTISLADVGAPCVSLSLPNTWTSTQTFSGAMNANAGGTLNGTFSGPTTLSGVYATTNTGTHSGAETFTNINNILYISQFAGADLGAKMNAAVTNCTVTLGLTACKYIIDISGTISTPPNFPVGSTVECTATAPIVLATTWAIMHRGTVYNLNSCEFKYNQDTSSTAIFVGKNAVGTVNTSGTAVTYVSGTNFSNIDVGDQVFINGTAYNVTAVTPPNSLTISVSAGTQNGVAYAGLLLMPTFGSYHSLVTIRDLTLFYAGAGTTTSTAFQAAYMSNLDVQNPRIVGFQGAQSVGLKLQGVYDSNFYHPILLVNQCQMILTNNTGGGGNIGSSQNRFFIPQVFNGGACTSSNAAIQISTSSGIFFDQPDMESNASTYTIWAADGTAFKTVVQFGDFERNGDGTVNSADIFLGGVPGSAQNVVANNSFQSLVANTPATGLICSSTGTTCQLYGNVWGPVNNHYTAAWNFQGGATGIIDGNNAGTASHSDPTYGSVRQIIDPSSLDAPTKSLGVSDTTGLVGLAVLTKTSGQGIYEWLTDSNTYNTCLGAEGASGDLLLRDGCFPGAAGTARFRIKRTSGTIQPEVAAAADVGAALNPFGNLWLGTAATNNFKFQPASTTGARIITVADPLSPTTVALPMTIANGTAAMTTAGIATGACGTTVTVAATGVLTTDVIDWARNAAATIGNGGGLTLNAWPTSGNVNFNYCNSSAGTITPTAMTVNWSVRRP
jgi:hypothetical protein